MVLESGANHRTSVGITAFGDLYADVFQKRSIKRNVKGMVRRHRGSIKHQPRGYHPPFICRPAAAEY